METLSEALLLSFLKDYEYDGIRSPGQAGINGRGSSTVLEIPPIGFTLYKGAPSNSFKEILATIWLRAGIVSLFFLGISIDLNTLHPSSFLDGDYFLYNRPLTRSLFHTVHELHGALSLLLGNG